MLNAAAPPPARSRRAQKSILPDWWLAALAILLLSGAVYRSALGGQPIWEDGKLTEAQGMTSLRACFTTPFLGGYFRPLVSVSFFLEHRFFAGEPFVYHQTNLLIHVFTTLALIGALRTAFGRRRVALAGGFLFAVQPAQVSAVAWIGGRTDSLCALWVALFAWAVVGAARATGRRRGWLLGASALAYAAALLTKEPALALLPLAPLAFALFGPGDGVGEGGRNPRAAVLRATLPFVAVAAAFLALWAAVGPHHLPASALHPWGDKLALGGRTLTYYALLLLLPTPQWMHTLTVIALARAGVWSVLTGYALLGLGIWAVWRWRRAAPAAAWFGALTLLSLLPLSLTPLIGLGPGGPLFVAPYWASVAGLGVATVLGWAASGLWAAGTRTPRARAVAWALGFLFGLWCLGLIVWGVPQWEDASTVYAQFAHHDPHSLFIEQGTVSSLISDGRQGQARTQAESLLSWLYRGTGWRATDTARRQFGDDPQVTARLGLSNGDGRTPRQALSDLFVLLGYTRQGGGDPREALTALQTAAALDPQSASADYGLAQWHYTRGNWRQAAQFAQTSLALNDRVPSVFYLLGASRGKLGDWPAACAAYQAAIRLQPWDVGPYLALADAQAAGHDPAGARATLEKAMTLDDVDPAPLRVRLARLPRPPRRTR